MKTKTSFALANILYILLFFCISNVFVSSSSSQIQRIVHALQKLDGEYRPQERWKLLSTHTGKLSCTVNGDVMTSEMVIILGVGQRSVWVLRMHKIACQNPDAVIDETDRKKDNWYDVSSSTATGINQTWLNFITSSTRYSNIIYGVGASLESCLSILRFDLAADFSVTEHLLRRKNYSKSYKKVRSCGFTSGPCPLGKNCLLFCYQQKQSRFGIKKYEAFFFREPEFGSMDSYITCQKLDLEGAIFKGHILSTSMDKTGIIYVMRRNMLTNSKNLLISQMVTRYRHPDIILKILKVFEIKPNYVVYMDVNTNGVLVFSNNHTVLIDGTKKDIADSELKSLVVSAKHNIKMYDMAVCWSYEGNGLVLISKKNPFKRKTAHL